jgi:quercetin dioxygenase-like cupin family protein
MWGPSEGAGETMFMRKSLLVTLAVVATAFAGSVLATPGSGVLSSMIWARAAFQSPVDIKVKVDEGNQEVIHVPNAQETVMQQLVFGPGGQTGWHSHPGPAIALIKAGQFTLYSSDDATCSGRTYSAGQAFVDHGQGHVHMGRNLSTTENAEVWVTYLDVPAGASVRIDQPNPGNCAF